MFASSRHTAYGTISIGALLTGIAITDLSKKYVPPAGFNSTINEQNQLHNGSFIDSSNFVSISTDVAKILVAGGLAFWIGVIYLIMFVFQLGFITQYITEPFVNSFTCGYAMHVIATQLKSLFGLHIQAYVGAFKLLKVNKLFEI